MKIKVSLILLVAIVLFLTWKVSAEMNLNQDLKKQVDGLSLKLSDKLAHESMELQTKCAEQAGTTYLHLGYKNDGLDSYQSHYNTKLNKCFISIQSLDNNGVVSESMFDAYEQRGYGFYIGKIGTDKPTYCNLTPSSTEKSNCKSKDEYEVFVSHYME
ncbi:MAG: hypothetical protein V4493_03315 [Pseudomonadota bacterium]